MYRSTGRVGEEVFGASPSTRALDRQWCHRRLRRLPGGASTPSSASSLAAYRVHSASPQSRLRIGAQLLAILWRARLRLRLDEVWSRLRAQGGGSSVRQSASPSSHCWPQGQRNGERAIASGERSATCAVRFVPTPAKRSAPCIAAKRQPGQGRPGRLQPVPTCPRLARAPRSGHRRSRRTGQCGEGSSRGGSSRRKMPRSQATHARTGWQPGRFRALSPPCRWNHPNSRSRTALQSPRSDALRETGLGILGAAPPGRVCATQLSPGTSRDCLDACLAKMVLTQSRTCSRLAKAAPISPQGSHRALAVAPVQEQEASTCHLAPLAAASAVSVGSPSSTGSSRRSPPSRRQPGLRRGLRRGLWLGLVQGGLEGRTRSIDLQSWAIAFPSPRLQVGKNHLRGLASSGVSFVSGGGSAASVRRRGRIRIASRLQRPKPQLRHSLRWG